MTDQPTNYPPQDKLEPIFRNAVAKLKDLAKEVIGDIESGYLPHLEDDTCANVRILAKSAVEDFLSGHDRDETAGWFSGYHRDAILQRIYELNREEIESKIGDMLRREIESLKGALERAWRR